MVNASGSNLGSAVLYLTTDDTGLVTGIANARNQVTNSLERIGRDTRLAGLVLSAALTAPLLGVGALAIKASLDFQTAFADVEKSVGGSREELAGINQEIRQMAGELPDTAASIAAVAAAGGRLGIAAPLLSNFTRVAVDLGHATDLASVQAITGISRLLGIMGETPQAARTVGDTLTVLGNNGRSSGAQILDLSLRLAGAGRVLGLTTNDILGLANGLASLGIPIESAGSSFSRVFAEIESAVQGGGTRLTTFAQVAGQTREEFAQLVRSSPIDAVLSFVRGLERVREEGGNVFKTLEDLGLGNLRVRDAVLRAAGANGELAQSIQLANNQSETAGALARTAGVVYDTDAAKLQAFAHRVNDLAISFGAELIPTLMNGVATLEPFLTTLAHGFINLPDSVQGLVIALGLLGAALGPIIFAFGSLITVATPLTSIIVGVVRWISSLIAVSATEAAATAANTAATNANTAARAQNLGAIMAQQRAQAAQAAAVAAGQVSTVGVTAATLAATASVVAIGAALVAGIVLWDRYSKAVARAKDEQETQQKASKLASQFPTAALEGQQQAAADRIARLNDQRLALIARLNNPEGEQGLGQDIVTDLAKVDDELRKANIDFGAATQALAKSKEEAAAAAKTQRDLAASLGEAGGNAATASNWVQGLADQYDELNSSALGAKLAVELANRQIGKLPSTLNLSALSSLNGEDAAAALAAATRPATGNDLADIDAVLSERRASEIASLQEQLRQQSTPEARAQLATLDALNEQINALRNPNKKVAATDFDRFLENRRQQLAGAAFASLPGLEPVRAQLEAVATSNVDNLTKLRAQFEILDRLWNNEAIPALQALGLAVDGTFRQDFENALQATELMKQRRDDLAEATIRDLPGFKAMQASLEHVNGNNVQKYLAQLKILDTFWTTVAVPGLKNAGVEVSSATREMFENFAKEVLQGKQKVDAEIGGLGGFLAELAIRRLNLGLDPGGGMFRLSDGILNGAKTVVYQQNDIAVGVRPDIPGGVDYAGLPVALKEPFTGAPANVG